MLNWRVSVEAYLSPKHVRDRATGCPFAALGGDVPRESETIRTRTAANSAIARRDPGRRPDSLLEVPCK
jgi:hypothetical protein